MNDHAHNKPAPLNTKFWTPGVMVMVAVILNGLMFIIARYVGGIGNISNLDNTHPWGLWIGIDVATGVALAAGGFTTAGIAHVFGKHQFEAVCRPGLLTAMLGYTFVALGLCVDIGRSWAIWKPTVYWQGNSVLFEVAMCVVCYLTVLYIEFFPIFAERFRGYFKLLDLADKYLDKIMWALIILGCVLSCMHQSALGTLMLIAPAKVHPLWYTPILPLLFLTSAISVGYPMVVFETTVATSSLNLAGEMNVLTPLTRFTVYLLGIYLSLKVGDMIYRGTYVYLFEGSIESKAFIVEMVLGVITPWFMLMSDKLRKNRALLLLACAMIVGGVAVNRVNVFLVSYTPPYSTGHYFPSIGEISVTACLICCIMFLYRVAVTFLPVLSAPKLEEA